MGFSLGALSGLVGFLGFGGSSPDTVNYQGKGLTDEMKHYLSGSVSDVALSAIGRSDRSDRMSEIFRNWLFGPPVKPLDPTLAFSQASALSGVKTQAGLGMGMSGAFGFGLPKLPSLDLGPMARGVPYSVPPLPTLRPR